MARVLAVAAAWTGAWWLIIGLLLAPLLPGGALTIVVAWLVTFAPLPLLVWRLGGTAPAAWLRIWVYRPFWYVQLFTPLMALTSLVGVLLGAPFGAAAAIGRVALFTAGVILTIAAAAGYVGSRQLQTKTLEVFFPDLPDGLDELRIVQVSDLHVGPHTSRRHIAAVKAAMRDAQPHLIAITGDQVDDYAGDVAHFGAFVDGVSAPLGIFAVAGNHDVYAGWSGVRAGLEALGITVLVNEAVAVTHRGEALWIAGTGDPAGAGAGPGPRLNGEAQPAPDVPRTLARVPANAFVIALAHNPALWPQLAERGVALTLSGHTHHGQFSIPRMQWSLASLFLEHAMGWHRRDGPLLYINPGTNYWGLPLRIGALPEVTVFTLRRRPGQQSQIAPAAA